MNILGLDIGATKIYYLVYNYPQKRIIYQNKLVYPDLTRNSFETVIDKIKAETKKFNYSKVGIGVAGKVKNNRIIYFPNFPALLNLNFKKYFPIERIYFENDANCFSLAEAKIGAGKKYNLIVGFTLGTGFGSGIIFNQKIYHGAFLGGGEMGHTIVDMQKMQELEDYCSAKFFKSKSVNPEIEENKAKAGNKKSIKIFEEYGKNLGIAIANIVNILDPEAVILGGGISKAYSLFISQAKKTAKKLIAYPESRKVKILKSKLGKAAGALGAVLICLEE